MYRWSWAPQPCHTCDTLHLCGTQGQVPPCPPPSPGARRSGVTTCLGHGGEAALALPMDCAGQPAIAVQSRGWEHTEVSVPGRDGYPGAASSCCQEGGQRLQGWGWGGGQGCRAVGQRDAPVKPWISTSLPQDSHSGCRAG